MACIRNGASISEGRVSGGVALMVKSGVRNDCVCCRHLFFWRSTNTTNKMWQLESPITELGNKPVQKHRSTNKIADDLYGDSSHQKTELGNKPLQKHRSTNKIADDLYSNSSC
jgi:hypothetical protein